MSRCIDHIIEARGFDEQVLAIREHLVMDQGMRTLEALAQITDGSTNLRQFDLILTSQRIQDMRFSKVAERQPRTLWIREFDHGLGSTTCAGPQRVRSSRDP